MSSATTSAIAKTATLSKRAESLPKVAMAIVSPLLLIGLLEGLAYVWERPGEQPSCLAAGRFTAHGLGTAS